MDGFVIRKYKKLYLKAGKAYAGTRFPLLVDPDKALNTSNEIDEKKFFEAVEVFCKEFPEEKRDGNEAK